jgi:membrane-bound lytic murein transglycosylase B
MRSLFFALAMIVPTAGLGGGGGLASAQDDGFQTYLQTLGTKARAAGVREATIASVLPTLTYSPRVVELDRGQPGGIGISAPSAIPNFAPYRAQHVDAARITRGRAAYQSLRPLLSRVEAQTGVPEAIMVSIFGNETNYGSYTGDFDLARALATLAYDGRRRQLFEDEFVAVLKLMDRGVSRETLKGSWAGATGYPQFLPSMVLRLGADGDGDGRVDIWGSRADALASIANYFVQAGWRPGERWGVAVTVPSSLDRNSIRDRTTSPRCPRVHDRHSRWLKMSEWRAMGVTPQGRTLPDNTLASLIEPDGPNATAYLLTGNYRVILDYNCSNFYALSVGLLADAVES